MSTSLWTDRAPDSFLTDAWRYLTLLFAPSDADALVAQLDAGEPTTRRANDILRAAGLTPAAQDDPSVQASIAWCSMYGTLPPVFLVVVKHRLIIADGYHRTSAIYWSDDFTEVPCIISYA